MKKWEDRIPACHMKSKESANKFIKYLPIIEEKLKNKEAYSWIRSGDGEYAVLLQDIKLPSWKNSNYCGATLPNKELKIRLVNAYNNSDAVGVIIGDNEMIQAFDVNNIRPKNIFYAYDNVHLLMNPKFVKLLTHYKVLVVCGGLKTANVQQIKEECKKKLDIDIEVLDNIKSYKDIKQCCDSISKKDFDIALVCAGVNAKIICNEMSKKMNKVFMDMGHAFDNALYNHPTKYKEYWLLDKSKLT